MKNLSIHIIAFFITISTFSQLKKITLSDAVLQQNRLFRADKMLGFQWIPNTNQYIFQEENYKKLMKANAADTKAVEVISLSELNKNLGTDFKTFFGIEFKDNAVFTIANGTKYYEYNLATKSGKLSQELASDSENGTFDNGKENIASYSDFFFVFIEKIKVVFFCKCDIFFSIIESSIF